jgi:hypothetical protein
LFEFEQLYDREEALKSAYLIDSWFREATDARFKGALGPFLGLVHNFQPDAFVPLVGYPVTHIEGKVVANPALHSKGTFGPWKLENMKEREREE